MTDAIPTDEDFGPNVFRPPQFSSKALSTNVNMPTLPPTFTPQSEQPRRDEPMDDKDVRRLEDRIEAVNSEGQLRLDATMARIEGSIARIGDQSATILTELSQQREDLRLQRSEFSTGISQATSVTRTWATWAIASVLAVGIGLAGLLIGTKQVWEMGIQVGQTLQNSTTQAPPKAP